MLTTTEIVLFVFCGLLLLALAFVVQVYQRSVRALVDMRVENLKWRGKVSRLLARRALTSATEMSSVTAKLAASEEYNRRLLAEVRGLRLNGLMLAPPPPPTQPAPLRIIEVPLRAAEEEESLENTLVNSDDRALTLIEMRELDL